MIVAWSVALVEAVKVIVAVKLMLTRSGATALPVNGKATVLSMAVWTFLQQRRRPVGSNPVNITGERPGRRRKDHLLDCKANVTVRLEVWSWPVRLTTEPLMTVAGRHRSKRNNPAIRRRWRKFRLL
jgi:hypothetical protein